MKKGFTLIELLVVVLIIAVLSSVALPQYAKSVEKARAAEAIQILGDVARSERVYHMTAGQYIDNMKKLDIEVPGDIANNGKVSYTNYFKVEVTNATSDIFEVYAQRVKAGTQNPITTGDQKYTIELSLNSDGDMERKCVDEPGSTDVNATCKSIANDPNGIIK